MKRNTSLACTNCWLCKEICPAYKVIKDETVSPRSKNNIASKFDNNYKEIDQSFFYKYCNGCEACLAICPINVWFDVIKVRQKIVDKWFVSEENKQMIENIKKYRNPFGKIENIDSSKPPDKLYCC